MFFSLTEKIIRQLKHDPAYTLDRSLGFRLLLQIVFYRAAALMRGVWYQLWLGQCGGNLFAGKGIQLRHPQLIKAGRSVIIEDHVTIDALSRDGVILGNNVTIAKYATIQCTGVIQHQGIGLIIGDNSAIGAYSFLGAQGGIVIGTNVIMGPKVSFHAENHRFSSLDVPIRLQGEERKGIVIEDDCWIGASSTILDGVHIGKGCVVAAGSIVTKNIPSYTISAGVPARIVNTRKAQDSTFEE